MVANATRTDSVEALERVLSYLVTERQRLRLVSAGKAELEANRLAIVAIQSHLGRALAEANLRRLAS